MGPTAQGAGILEVGETERHELGWLELLWVWGIETLADGHFRRLSHYGVQVLSLLTRPSHAILGHMKAIVNVVQLAIYVTRALLISYFKRNTIDATNLTAGR